MATTVSDSYSFSFVIDNFLTLSSSGGGDYKFTASDYNLPSHNVQMIPGMPDNLFTLIAEIPSPYLIITYDVSGSGNLGGHECYMTYTLYTDVSFYDGTQIKGTEITASDYAPNNGGQINTGWINIPYTGSSAMYNIVFWQACNGSGCGTCPSYIWGSIKMSLRVNVTIRAVEYCTLTGTENIHGDFCYNYISNYMVSNANSSSLYMQSIAKYLNEYCTTKYPTQGLSLFNDPNTVDAKDYNLCACNMNESDYLTFLESLKSQFPNLSIGSLRANCLLPACDISTFKPQSLGGCPVPQCLNIVNINKSDIAGPVTVNQNADCTSIGITNSPGAPSTDYIPPSPPQSTKSVSNTSKIIIIVVTVIVVVIIAIILIVVVFHKKK